MDAAPGSRPDVLIGFAEDGDLAPRLAARLDIPYRQVQLHRFPDGESLVRLEGTPDHAVILRPLNQPNAKLVELQFLAGTLRERGTRRIDLVAPYLAYMRQDMEFRPGEVVSQRILGRWLGGLFDLILAVEPHLHRTHTLAEIFPGCRAEALTAGSLIADWARGLGADAGWVVLGPDEEACTLVQSVAGPLGVASLCARKERRGDRDVTVTLPPGSDLSGRTVLLVDDVVSSGGTLLDGARVAKRHGAARLLAFTTHAVFAPEMLGVFAEAGIERVGSADGVPHPSNAVTLAPLLAEALARLG